MRQRQWLPGARSWRNRNRLLHSATTRQLSGVQKRRASSSGSVCVFVENSLRLQCVSTTSTCSRPGCCCGIKDPFRNGEKKQLYRHNCRYRLRKKRHKRVVTERIPETAERAVQAAKTGNGLCWELTHVRCDENDALFASSVSGESIHDKGLFRSERNALFNSLFSFLVCGRESQSDISGRTVNIR